MPLTKRTKGLTVPKMHAHGQDNT